MLRFDASMLVVLFPPLLLAALARLLPPEEEFAALSDDDVAPLTDVAMLLAWLLLLPSVVATMTALSTGVIVGGPVIGTGASAVGTGVGVPVVGTGVGVPVVGVGVVPTGGWSPVA